MLYWADGYFIGVNDKLKNGRHRKYDCTGPVSVLPESSDKALAQYTLLKYSE